MLKRFWSSLTTLLFPPSPSIEQEAADLVNLVAAPEPVLTLLPLISGGADTTVPKPAHRTYRSSIHGA